jgi:hypothetical protein
VEAGSVLLVIAGGPLWVALGYAAVGLAIWMLRGRVTGRRGGHAAAPGITGSRAVRRLQQPSGAPSQGPRSVTPLAGASVAPARLEAILEAGPHEQEHGDHVERVDGPMAGVGEDDRSDHPILGVNDGGPASCGAAGRASRAARGYLEHLTSVLLLAGPGAGALFGA